MSNTHNYPYFLQDFASFQTHLTQQFAGLTSHAIGERFASMAQSIAPYTSTGRRFLAFECRQHSHDQGVDIVASNDEGSMLCIQAKYSVKGKQEFDSIISKFRHYYDQHVYNELPLFTGVDISETGITDFYFQIITAHDLKEIRRLYEKSHLASLPFYNDLIAQGRLEIIDGPRLLAILKENFLRSYGTSLDFELEFATPVIQWNDVYIGVLGSDKLRELYKRYGSAIFFENIRDYLGASNNAPVNLDIIATATNTPDQMLSRNNGIVIKASRVSRLNDMVLQLMDASIVNGCQTTVSIVEHSPDTHQSFLSVKVVETENAWDVTRAANWQNQIAKLDLELAQFLRPQRVKYAAAHQGIGVSDNSDAFAVLDTLYQKEITYHDLRSLFIGLFSTRPGDLFSSDPSAILFDVLERFYQDDPDGSDLFERIFAIQLAANECVRNMTATFEKDEESAQLYRRFFHESTYTYRAFLTLVACCSATQIDITATKGSDEKYQARRNMIEAVYALIENNFEEFLAWYKEAFKTIVMTSPKKIDEDAVKQRLWDHMKSLNFQRLLSDIRLSRRLSD